ncbi:hypothetical protein PFICI_00953 [Pestalotiopsis fici W106-1]|uniref:Uncharacterized protein n=1 Tax=Pestalotiopsis fici (strain W106-1 / CGMCC3.15140) TaxID=1229662 RepID=W3XMD5_PESFW|nr:uncharacterized protein PFICI_00953 [Pestalotiopsis fici W106-1]ETS87125.1 hypothetical protein PFICI_00953 [Pestalotiopsis fici W106-1]
MNLDDGLLQRLVLPIALCGLIACIWTNLHSWYRLRHIPGPSQAALSSFWLAFTSLKGQNNDLWIHLDEKYGQLVRVAPNLVTTSDPKTIRRMASARSTCWKDEWYRRARFEAGIDTLFTLLHPRAHDEYKSKAAAGYSGREAPSIETSINEQIQAAIDLLRHKYLSTSTGGNTGDQVNDQQKSLFRPLDMANFSTYFTLDVITKVAFGEAFGCLQHDADVSGFITELQGFLPFGSFLSYIPSWLYDAISLTLSYTTRLDDSQGVGLLRRIARESVTKRFEQSADAQKDMLGAFMRHGMSFEECRDEATFMIATGSDTTSSVIHYTMLHLMTNPRVYQTLKNTVRQAVLQGSASCPITQKEAMVLPYLRAVIFEGLRMRAPAPGIHARVTSKEGEHICGKFIPPGTGVGTNVSAMLLNPDLFGADAASFRPERFLDAENLGDAAIRLRMERDVELVFGYGRWQCAGKTVAFMELSKIYFELFRHFDFELINPINPIQRTNSYGLWIEEGMMVKVTDAPVI